MTINPWYVGNTHTALHGQIRQDNGAPLDLTGATLTIEFRKVTVPPTYRAGTGTFTVTDETNGLYEYRPSGEDVSISGLFDTQVTATFTDGSVPMDPFRWAILPAL